MTPNEEREVRILEQLERDVREAEDVLSMAQSVLSNAMAGASEAAREYIRRRDDED